MFSQLRGLGRVGLESRDHRIIAFGGRWSTEHLRWIIQSCHARHVHNPGHDICGRRNLAEHQCNCNHGMSCRLMLLEMQMHIFPKRREDSLSAHLTNVNAGHDVEEQRAVDLVRVASARLSSVLVANSLGAVRVTPTRAGPRRLWIRCSEALSSRCGSR